MRAYHRRRRRRVTIQNSVARRMNLVRLGMKPVCDTKQIIVIMMIYTIMAPHIFQLIIVNVFPVIRLLAHLLLFLLSGTTTRCFAVATAERIKFNFIEGNWIERIMLLMLSSTNPGEIYQFHDYVSCYTASSFFVAHFPIFGHSHSTFQRFFSNKFSDYFECD